MGFYAVKRAEIKGNKIAVGPNHGFYALAIYDLQLHSSVLSDFVLSSNFAIVNYLTVP
jgi:uncharacterized membrane protein (DUF2068 family)